MGIFSHELSTFKYAGFTDRAQIDPLYVVNSTFFKAFCETARQSMPHFCHGIDSIVPVQKLYQFCCESFCATQWSEGLTKPVLS